MKIYKRTNHHLLCGHWNDSPLEIGLTQVIKRIPESETYHYHDYHEYYLVLQGKGKLNVNGHEIPLEAETIIMVEPGERHQIMWIDPNEGIQWVIIKEISKPNSKVKIKEQDNV